MNGRLNALLAALLILAAGVGAVSAVQLNVGSVSLANLDDPGEVTLSLDAAPSGGLSGYSVTFTIANPSAAEIVGVQFPSWTDPAPDFRSGSYDATSATMKVADVENAIGPALDLGGVTVKGLVAGASSDITVRVNQMDDDNGNEVTVPDAAGTISVSQAPGSLLVSSTPVGASIFVDGEAKGTTIQGGMTVSGLTPQLHEVKATLATYVDGIQQVTVLSGQTVPVNFALQKPVTIIVRTSPVECDVFFNSVPKGTTGPTGSVTIPGNPPGFYSVKVTKTGYYAKWINRTLSQGVTSTFPFTLSPATNTIPDNIPPYGSLGVNSTPEGAKVYIDGAETDLETPAWTELDPGEHSVYVTLDGYLTPPPREPTIVVHEQVNLDFQLLPEPAPSNGCLWPANHQFVDMTLSPMTGRDGNPLVLRVTGITSDEATASDKGSGGAQHAPDAAIGKGAAFKLRAERSGNGNGRMYQVSFTAQDAGTGEISTGSVRVCVPRDQADRCVCRDDGQNHDATAKN